MIGKIKCSKCEREMEFGGMSANLGRTHSAKRNQFENMLKIMGWKKSAATWVCDQCQ